MIFQWLGVNQEWRNEEPKCENLCQLGYHVKTKTDVTFSGNLMLICTITGRGFL